MITSQTNPVEVMRTRQLLEPEIARLAALNATAQNIDEMRLCMAKSRVAETWRNYESWDNRLHRVIAEATQNKLLLALFDTLNSVRRVVVWGRLRHNKPKPDSGHHSFVEHEAIVEAIAERDMARAADSMRRSGIGSQEPSRRLRQQRLSARKLCASEKEYEDPNASMGHKTTLSELIKCVCYRELSRRNQGQSGHPIFDVRFRGQSGRVREGLNRSAISQHRKFAGVEILLSERLESTRIGHSRRPP
jgi:hypothetical protein